ncbi:MAG: AraC family transcriptional regulator [Paenibacillus sp.]|jgi:AraC-like DNA-binding protein|nr:AraC family transcriptional regulator [Paenibacillus sp.]
MLPANLPGDEELHSDFPFSLKIHRLNGNVRPHTHSFIEFTYAFQGRGVEIINGVERKITPGTFTLLFPYQVHELVIEPGNELCLYVGGIGLKAFFGIDDSVLALNELIVQVNHEGSASYQLDEETAERFIPLFEQMLFEIQSNQSWNKLMFKAKLVETLVLFDRFRNIRQTSGRNASVSKKKKSVWNIVHYVYTNFRQEITLQSLAELFHLSAPHISTSFKQVMGENFHDFLEKTRISHACSLLVSSEQKITDIAFEVGFSSFPTFSRVFQTRMHMTPSSYRKLKAISLHS